MHLSRLVSVFSFFGALAIGIATGYVASGSKELADEVPPPAPAPIFSGEPASRVVLVPLRIEDLRGVWKGTWGYGREECTIEITRIKGKKFYGTLKKEGFEIALEGTIDTEERTVFFRETKVLKHGSRYSSWSLGTNIGSFTHDGRILGGTGIDEAGTYGWDVHKD